MRAVTSCKVAGPVGEYRSVVARMVGRDSVRYTVPWGVRPTAWEPGRWTCSSERPPALDPREVGVSIHNQPFVFIAS